MVIARTKVLGIILVVFSLLQIYLYFVLTFSSEHDLWLIYFDPRIGLFFLETVIRGAEQVAPGVMRWLSSGWILALGIMMVARRPLVKTYIVSEILLFIPNIGFSLIVAAANLGATHGFSVGELFYPFLVMLVFSITPLSLAGWIMWRSRSEDEVKIFQ